MADPGAGGLAGADEDEDGATVWLGTPVEKRVSHPGGAYQLGGNRGSAKYKSMSKRGRSQSANRSSETSRPPEGDLGGADDEILARRNSASDPTSAGLMAAAAAAAAAGKDHDKEQVVASRGSGTSSMLSTDWASTRSGDAQIFSASEQPSGGAESPLNTNIVMESISGHDLIDTSRLAGCLRRTSTRIDHHGARLDRVEKLIDLFPADYVTAEQIAESTDRMDLLAQKIERLLEDAERTQRVEIAKLNGDLTNVVASIGSLESAVIKIESTQKTIVRSFDDLQRQIGQRAAVDDLRAVRAQVGECAVKEDLARLEERMQGYAAREDVESMRAAMENGFSNKKTAQQLGALQDSFAAQLGVVQLSLQKCANKDEMMEARKASETAAQMAKSVGETAQSVQRSVEELAQRLAKVDAVLGEDEASGEADSSHSASQGVARRMSVDPEALADLTSRVTAAESTCNRLADQFDAVSDSVSMNSRSMQSQANMLQDLTNEVNKKLSNAEWEQIEAEISRVYATKAQVAESVEPIVKKLNQVVGKLIDLDKDLAGKADNQTVVENREHIQDLFRVIHDQVSRAATVSPNTTANPSEAGGVAASATGSPASTLAPRMPVSLDVSNAGGASAPRAGSAKLKTLQQQVESQGKLLQELRAATKLARPGDAEPGGDRESRFVERIEQQDREISSLRASIEELRSLFVAGGDRVREQMALAERPVITTVRKASSASDHIPARPEGSAPKTAPSPRVQAVASTSSDKQRWERAEKERWLAETRAKTPEMP